MSALSAALLLVLPVSRQEFLDRVNHSDYLRRFSGNPEFWWPRYEEDVAKPLIELGQAARHAGAEIIEGATLGSLTEAMTRFETVVLLSHWKGPSVLPEDMLETSPASFVARLKSTPDAGKWLTEKFATHPPKDTSAVRPLLNAFVEAGEIGDIFGDGFKLEAHPFTLKSIRRDKLDKIFGGLIHPGNRVEFTDGLYEKEAVAVAVPKRFRGTFDLTTCTSMYLSDYLFRHSRGAYRTVQFECPQQPWVTSLVLERVFELHGEGFSYRDARNKALKDLESAISIQPRSFWTKLLALFNRGRVS
jgi:hypothetical protein